MQMNDLKPAPGSRHKRKRKGRGVGSGLGKTAGRGEAGQNKRSGGGVRRDFEGGQMPLSRRLPKRGFKNIFKKQIVSVNVKDLNNRFEDGEEVTPEALIEKRLIKAVKDGVKILGEGELEKKLVVKAHAFSQSAVEKIEASGGKAEVI